MHGASHSQGHTHSVYASPRHVNACQLESQRGLERLPVETNGLPSRHAGGAPWPIALRATACDGKIVWIGCQRYHGSWCQG
jgi:hypothetical protein